MSYEGYYQLVCVSGHLNEVDAYDYCQGEEMCRTCGAKIVWWNSVDTTNGSFCDCPAGDWAAGIIEGDPNICCDDCDNGRIDGHVELEVLQFAQFEKCHCCGHKKLISHETYKVPSNKGHHIK